MNTLSNQRPAGHADGAFYSAMPVFRGFANLMDPSLYKPVPDGWLIGVADIVNSTQAIANNRYKAVNMAGAAVMTAGDRSGRKRHPFGSATCIALPFLCHSR